MRGMFMRLRTFSVFLGIAAVIYMIFFLFFAESLLTTEDSARKLAIGAAITEFGIQDYNSDPLIHSFKEKRKVIENNPSFIHRYQRKSYYRVLIESEDLKYPVIIYTIDAKNGNLISCSYGTDKVSYY